MKKQICSLLSLFLLFPAISNAQHSSIVYPGQDGKLVYKPYTEQGDILPDFSFCGYRGGGVAIPDVPVGITLEPGDFSSDDGERIQEAIDRLSGKKPDKNGFRGAVLLKKGRYRLDRTIRINASGVVLRGEDQEATQLVLTVRKAVSCITIGNDGKLKKVSGSEQAITDAYVPSGTRKIHVKDGSKFRPGDEVIVQRNTNQHWVTTLGMDRIPAYWHDVKDLSAKELEQYRKEGKLSADGTKYNTTVQWKAGDRTLLFERVVTAVSGNELTLDIPLVNAVQEEFGGGVVYKYTFENRPSDIGVERLTIISEFDPAVTAKYRNETYYSDEQHMSTGVSFRACRNVWAREVTVKHAGFRGIASSLHCAFLTVQDCRVVEPVSIVTGKRRYTYNLGGQMGLVQRCYSSHGRHDFVQGANVPGPNAFVDCQAEHAYACSEPHHRWSAGTLFDNCELSGPSAYINFANRGRSGSGHGWNGAQMVAWNCKAPFIVVMKPPTAQNFSIGNYGYGEGVDREEADQKMRERAERLKKAHGIEFEFQGGPVYGDGFIESPLAYVKPQFLYYKQLWDRLGRRAVIQVTTPEQQKLIFE